MNGKGIESRPEMRIRKMGTGSAQVARGIAARHSRDRSCGASGGRAYLRGGLERTMKRYRLPVPRVQTQTVAPRAESSRAKKNAGCGYFSVSAKKCTGKDGPRAGEIDKGMDANLDQATVEIVMGRWVEEGGDDANEKEGIGQGDPMQTRACGEDGRWGVCLTWRKAERAECRCNGAFGATVRQGSGVMTGVIKRTWEANHAASRSVNGEGWREIV
ncbi:hypothetical protein B0H13DRAFT_2288374 [Mycena leptocephala]|nr:hypothetical protein B0H13DRAFT_2288374 [Mycena leptocephala]